MDYHAYVTSRMSLPVFKTLLSKLVPEATISDYYAVPAVYRITLNDITYDIRYCSTEDELRQHLLLVIPEYFL